MDQHLDAFRKKRPEVVFEWKDSETDAEGWVVINSLRGGAAGGGTRIRKGLDRAEVESLAKIMEIKFTVSGPAIGGAKSGINFDPQDPRKKEVLHRWYKAVIPLLKRYYGTGGDLNVDEIRDVIPITETYGLWHPQEGIVNGHIKPDEKSKIQILGQLRHGVSKRIEDQRYTPEVSARLTVADMITGYGVSASVQHFYDLFHGETLAGKRAVIQGWGNVAAAAAYYLAEQGLKITGIIDRAGGLIVPEGLALEAVKRLFLDRNDNQLVAKGMLSFEEAQARIWDTPCDVFIPGAASRLVNQSQLERLQKAGCSVISCGANVPFTEQDLFFGDTTAWADRHFSLIPDFIANCGMARVFAFLMQESAVEITDENIFQDVSEVIRKALEEVYLKHPKPDRLTETALSIALHKLI